MEKKYVYLFREGNANMRELLGGKGANLAEMTNLGLPIPQGFTITTEACIEYYNNNENISEEIKHDIELEKGSISRLTITPEKCQSVVQYLRSTDEFKNGSFKNMRDFSIVIALADLTDEEVIFAYIQKKIENQIIF